MNPILAELDSRLHILRAAAGTEHAEEMRPPLLMLGTSERVGSNWLSDALRPVMDQHNEPFRQQLTGSHPLSPLNPNPASFDEAADRLDGYGRHWLVCFAMSKYGRHQQVVKETNVYFTIFSLLALFPSAPVVVLARSPLGVASSFVRGGLFRRWDYAARYRQMTAITRCPRHRAYAGMVPDDDPPDLVALVRLQVLNTVLLAVALEGRDAAHVGYETSVLCPTVSLAVLAAMLPELSGKLQLGRSADGAHDQPTGLAEDTFVTTAAKTELIAHLDAYAAEQVRAATAATLAAARRQVGPTVAATAATWLGGDHLYQLAPAPSKPRPRPGGRAPTTQVPVSYVQRRGLAWRNLLVSNTEYAAFLNELAAAGLPIQLDQSTLLVCKMPHGRGGRLHYDNARGHWYASSGYEAIRPIG